jgi:hypothetical protein
MMVLGWRKRGRKIRIVGGSETGSSSVSSKRRGTGSVATNFMENINFLLSQWFSNFFADGTLKLCNVIDGIPSSLHQ